ncbi:osmotically inducible protein C [Pseudothermotoga hypogea DSM 11164 = NBRC 106472]|uniref:Osmotically inducible protein C n=1 Tax=Pseudothermotoga hypogea DSM 11164 = NBRC 106472 TaxID=1123384 RepID=A0A0X1KSM6_9THEM|nr:MULTISPECIES: OsmC family protein [Pseudothermotoga]AJC74327.1 osmotically inducible protein C [Pseudothermotoga hypogea DSM 11164 = NBRC 106472]MBC7122694.1 OsmC family protein [Pseudothermotoga sp.]MDI6862424.1 OsmC family protein [Pseudothermotoga sp.]
MDLKFSISATSETPTRTQVKARNFTMYVDEPPQLGGEDKGANPVEYMLAALAGCLNVVGHMVAEEMNIKLDGLTIDIEGILNPAKFQGKSDAERAGYKEINVTIRAKTNAPDDVLKKWIETVESRCPVSDNIANPTPVKFNVTKV